MANYSTNANITLTVNGKQARDMLSKLEREARHLKKKLDEATALGDKEGMKKYQKQLISTNSLMEKLKGEAKSVDQILRQIDNATPKELAKTYKSLQNELNGMKRGTKAWNDQLAKIKLVKSEIEKVNANVKLMTSSTSAMSRFWSSVAHNVNRFGLAVMTAVGAIAGVIQAGRRSVQDYAEMEESMANTRKYTQLTREEVEILNDEFREMGSRLSRIKLNDFAQEGGRLGYNTIQKVKEYVEAASIVSVALVDLGEGATQTIAKISNIWGEEEKFGVRDSMLKVGSAVNVLSQNCTASKPYLVEFTKRLSGIATQAKMSIPEVLAFGATLDANGQKVEMSATALQRLVMMLFQKPRELAKTVGLDVESFLETLHKSTTEGVMVFLEAVNKLGSKDGLEVLAPMFKDMGADGVRLQQVLSSLAGHIDMVRWEIGEANKAYKEGTSASNEYEIFNNTVQARLEKAKYNLHEISVELGERLYPLLSHVYTSTGLLLRTLSGFVKFVTDNGAAIATLTMTVTAYAAATFLANKWLSVQKGLTMGLTAVHYLYETAVKLSSVTMTLFTRGLKAAQAEAASLNLIMKANPWGMAMAAVAALVAWIWKLTDATDSFLKKCREQISTLGILDDAYMKEQRQIDETVGKLQGLDKASSKYKKTKDEFIKQYGKYLSGLINEKGEIINLAKAYDRLTQAAKRSNLERQIQKVRDNIDSEYFSYLNEQLKALKENMLYWGIDAKTAARVTAQVESYATGLTDKISDEALGVINSVTNKATASGTTGLNSVWENAKSISNWVLSWGNPSSDMLFNNTYPTNIVSGITSNKKDWDASKKEIDDMEPTIYENNLDSPLAGFTEEDLRSFHKILKSVESNYEDRKKLKVIPGIRRLLDKMSISPNILDMSVVYDHVVKTLEEEFAERGLPVDEKSEVNIETDPNFQMSQKDIDKENRAKSAEEKRRKVMESKEFRDEWDRIKKERFESEGMMISDKMEGKLSYTDVVERQFSILEKYYEDSIGLFKKYALEEDDEYGKLMKGAEENEQSYRQKQQIFSKDAAKRVLDSTTAQIEMEYRLIEQPTLAQTIEYEDKKAKAKTDYYNNLLALYNKGDKEYHDTVIEMERSEDDYKLKQKELFHKTLNSLRKKYDRQYLFDNYELEKAALDKLLEQQIINLEQYEKYLKQLKRKEATSAGVLPKEKPWEKKEREKGKAKSDVDSALEAGLINEEEARKRLAEIEREYALSMAEIFKDVDDEWIKSISNLYDAWQDFFLALQNGSDDWIGSLSTALGASITMMTAVMQTAQQFSEANAKIQTAKIEKEYDAQINMAEGNVYRTTMLERKKDKEVKAIKKKSTEQSFNIQVITAVAQTAQNAIAAYGSAASIPIVGYILAPIAAAMAVAAGVVQIASIKKQKQAALAEAGYSSGGFTPEGDIYEPAGIVHAGEWVASQKLVRNPRTRPILEMLDSAQRNNTVGSITMNDVSRYVTSPIANASYLSAQRQPETSVVEYRPVRESESETVRVIRRLSERLDEPFVTVATVTGDMGINKAQEDYERMMRNKSPKSKNK